MEIKTLDELQSAVETKTKENQHKELISQATELGIDLKEYGLNADGTPIVGEVKVEVKPEVKVEAKVEKSAEELKEEKEGQTKALVEGVTAALKEAFKPTEEKTVEKAKVYG